MGTSHVPPHALTTRRSLAFTDGQLETLKWVALASMFLDHFGRHLLGYGQETWVFALGRIAFPLFALVLGSNLAREGHQPERAARTARRLAIWCAVSVFPSIWARGEPMVVNVLGTLGLGAIVCWSLASQASLLLRVAVCVAAAVASNHVEFGLMGVFLVPAVYLALAGRPGEGGVLAAVLFLTTAWFNGSFGGVPAFAGTLAALVIAVLVRQLPLAVPRVGRLFYVIYPLHLALIGFLKSGGSP
jgi:hypothetical protein